MIETILKILPGILAILFLLVMLYGFWQGLGLRPHKPGNRPPKPPLWWWY
jgi:hypothetical protein